MESVILEEDIDENYEPTEAEIEKSFVEALTAVRTAQISGTTLDLIDATGKRRMRLEARGR